MPLTPEDVSNKRFTPVRLREGYDMGEVDQFLDEVESELARLLGENDTLRAKGPVTDGRPGPSGDTARTTEAGPDTGPVTTAISTDDVLVGVRFRPGAGRARAHIGGSDGKGGQGWLGTWNGCRNAAPGRAWGGG